jgi:uncharacterized protein with HEPN domain
MKHNLGDRERIIHIIEAIENIEIILRGVSLEDFSNNLEKKLAIERLLEIIGEATNHISEEVLHNTKTSSPWKKIISTRNIISHEYFRIDETLLYQIATIDMVPLKKDIQSILKDLDQYSK